ncbi:MAG: hypothetical protein K9L62_00545 [Vallitaleaceae bacterium]|nr:hypothetical protein [Vallitaleaceae bacterium]
MKKKVYKADQMPSSIEDDCVEWASADYDCNVKINSLPNGKVKLSGEWLEWNEEKQDWDSKPMTRNEVVEIMHKVDMVLPSANGVRHLKDRFQIKSPA